MVVSIHEQSFSVVNGRWHLWAVVFCCGQLFSYGGAICICGQSFAFMGSRLHSWAAIGIHGQSVLLQIVVGMGHCVVVVIRGVIVWWLWWLMEERTDVACCDISVMFKLTH